MSGARAPQTDQDPHGQSHRGGQDKPSAIASFDLVEKPDGSLAMVPAASGRWILRSDMDAALARDRAVRAPSDAGRDGRPRETLVFLRDVIDRNITENGLNRDRLILDGEIHEGPAVGWILRTLKAIRDVCENSLAVPASGETRPDGTLASGHPAADSGMHMVKRESPEC